MVNHLSEINKIVSLRRLIDWKGLKTKIKDGLTLFPTQQLMLETYVIRADGTIREHHKGKAHSYTIGWLQHIELMSNHNYNTALQGQAVSNQVLMKDTSGSARTFYNGKCHIRQSKFLFVPALLYCCAFNYYNLWYSCWHWLDCRLEPTIIHYKR